MNTSRTPMRAVASSSSATMCTSAAGITIHGVQSWSARTARPLALAISQKKRSNQDFLVTVTAGRAVVCTAEVSVVVVVLAVEVTAVAVDALVAAVVPVVATAATVAGCSG